MAILSQLIDARELQNMSAEQLRSLILRLDDEIKFGASAGEKLLVSIEANIIGVRADQPAGANIEVVRTTAGAAELRKEPASTKKASTKSTKKGK